MLANRLNFGSRIQRFKLKVLELDLDLWIPNHRVLMVVVPNDDENGQNGYDCRDGRGDGRGHGDDDRDEMPAPPPVGG